MANKVSKNTQELQIEVNKRASELKDYLKVYGPKLLLVGGVTVASYFLLKFLIVKLATRF